MSGADEESCTEGAGAQSIPPPGKTKAAPGQSKKVEKPNKKKKMDSDQNSRTGGIPTPMADHGYETGGSQGYVSSHTGYSSSGYDTEYPSLKDDDIHRVVHHRPPDHVTSPIGHAPNQYLPMNHSSIGHITDKSMRQNRMVPTPKRAPPSYGVPPPTSQSMYLSYPDPLLSGCPPNDQQAQCVVHYTVPVGNGGGAHHTRYPDQGPAYVTVSVQRRFGADMTSSGYSSLRSSSPSRVDQKLPAEDPPLSSSGHGGGFGLRNPVMTTSRSTFSSTSSRTSTPCSNGRGEAKPLPPLSEGQMMLPPKTPPLAGHPWKHAMRSDDLKRSMDEHSERSWRSYSSHSSRYSGSELSDELLESLPTSGALRNTFAKAPPLPLPESMQSLPRVPAPMGCGPLDEFPELSGDFPSDGSDLTFPLHHYGNDVLPYSEQCLFDGNIPISQSQLMLANGLLSDTFAGDAAGSNMVIGDMASIATTLSSESRHYWEGMLQPAD